MPSSQIMLTQPSLSQLSQHLDPQLKNQLMKQLSPQDLSKIKKGFELYKGKVSQQQFICVMIDALYGKKKHIYEYGKEILTFIQLFLLIDLKNVGKIRFQDFTNYLIDRQKTNNKVEDCHFQPNLQLNQLDISAEKVFQLKNSDNLGILENNKKNVVILEKKTYKPIQNIAFGGVIINSIIYLSNYKVYCIATNDKFLNFYDSSQKQLIRRLLLPDPIFHMLSHSLPSPRVICCSTSGHIYQLSLSKLLAILNRKDKQAQKQQQKRKHQYPSHQLYKAFLTSKVLSVQPDLTCIEVMEPLELLVTGSNDSKVRLYDMREGGLALAKELDGHYKGVKGVAVSEIHKVIVSCSFDFDLLVWNAYLEHPVARLEGHEAPLVNVCCPNKYDIIISMDAKSVMKIWNCQNYQLIQNLLIYQNFPLNTSVNFLYKTESDMALIYTKKLRFFEYIVSYNPRVTDDYEGASVRYSSKNLQIYIGSRRDVKVWSIEKGVQARVYNQVIQSDIVILELDHRERRLFVGSIEGQIVAVDVFSGLTISKYSSHSLEISLLLYNEQNQLLITGGWDKKLKIHNDTQHLERIQNRQNVLRNINNISQKDLAGGAFSQAQLFIATHSKTNVCRIWDFQKGFLQAQLILPNPIVSIFFLSPLPLLIICDIKGSIYLITTKHHFSKPYSLLCQWKNMYSIQKTSQITFISYSLTKQSHWLILGDEYGYVRIIDLTQFIHQHNLKPISLQMLGNKNPYRIEDYNYVGMSELSLNSHDFSGNQVKVIVPPEEIRQLYQIKAHEDRFTYVALVQESQERLVLTAGADRLVRLWNCQGEARGVLKQGLVENASWMYKLGSKWQNKQNIQFKRIKGRLQLNFQEYLIKKRLSIIPFTQQQSLEQVDNNQIYKDLKQVDGYLSRTQSSNPNKKKSARLY